MAHRIVQAIPNESSTIDVMLSNILGPYLIVFLT